MLFVSIVQGILWQRQNRQPWGDVVYRIGPTTHGMQAGCHKRQRLSTRLRTMVYKTLAGSHGRPRYLPRVCGCPSPESGVRPCIVIGKVRDYYEAFSDPNHCLLRLSMFLSTFFIQFYPSQTKILEGWTNISECVFEALFKGVSTRFVLHNVEKCFENEL